MPVRKSFASRPAIAVPYPYFGGKSRIAEQVWQRFGSVENYVDPFFGGGAMLLAVPRDAARTETVNDLNAFISNFFRAVQADPDAVTYYTDYPINETDLYARHKWLVTEGRKIVNHKVLSDDPDYYDAKVAGWWVWGMSQWIASGWCEVGAESVDPTGFVLDGSGSAEDVPELRPDLTFKGTNLTDNREVSQTRPQLTSKNGTVAHMIAGDVSQIKPRLTGDGEGINARSRTGELGQYIRSLQDRLRRVRVCCGDWKRVLTPAVTTGNGVTAVFLDPPYSFAERAAVYSVDSDVAHEVRAWALANGENPKLRIALCGYFEEHEQYMPANWMRLRWKASGGYAKAGNRAAANAYRETVWFSPARVQPLV